MQPEANQLRPPVQGVVHAAEQIAIFRPGDNVRVLSRLPIGHYRVPTYLRGKTGVVETVILPIAVDNEEEGFGRNAGARRHYYRIGFLMNALWPNYSGPRQDGLRIEVFETWLERSDS